MTLHAPHLGRLSGFVHAHYVASVIGALAIVVGGTANAGVAWDSTQSSSRTPHRRPALNSWR